MTDATPTQGAETAATLPILDEANEYVRMRKLGLQGTMHPLRQQKAIRVADLLNRLEAACKGDMTRFTYCVQIVKESAQDHEQKIGDLIAAIHTGTLFPSDAPEAPPISTEGMTRQQKRAAARAAKRRTT